MNKFVASGVIPSAAALKLPSRATVSNTEIARNGSLDNVIPASQLGCADENMIPRR